MIEETFKGLKFEEALDKIRDYMERYHPAGYGTEVKRLSLDLEGWTLTMGRFKSCD